MQQKDSQNTAWKIAKTFWKDTEKVAIKFSKTYPKFWASEKQHFSGECARTIRLHMAWFVVRMTNRNTHAQKYCQSDEHCSQTWHATLVLHTNLVGQQKCGRTASAISETQLKFYTRVRHTRDARDFAVKVEVHQQNIINLKAEMQYIKIQNYKNYIDVILVMTSTPPSKDKTGRVLTTAKINLHHNLELKSLKVCDSNTQNSNTIIIIQARIQITQLNCKMHKIHAYMSLALVCGKAGHDMATYFWMKEFTLYFPSANFMRWQSPVSASTCKPKKICTFQQHFIHGMISGTTSIWWETWQTVCFYVWLTWNWDNLELIFLKSKCPSHQPAIAKFVLRQVLQWAMISF